MGPGANESDVQIPSSPTPSSPQTMKPIKFGNQYEKTPQPKVGKIALLKAQHRQDMRKLLYSQERKEPEMAPQRAVKKNNFLLIK